MSGIDKGAPAKDHEGAGETFAVPMIGIGDLAREFGISVRTLRFYQTKGLLSTHWNGRARSFRSEDRDRLAAILQGKRLGFSLKEIRDIVGTGQMTLENGLSLSRDECLAQIDRLETERRAIDQSLADLRSISVTLGAPCDDQNPEPVRRVKAS